MHINPPVQALNRVSPTHSALIIDHLHITPYHTHPGILGLTFQAVTANMIGTGAAGAGHVIAVGLRGSTDRDPNSIHLFY
jgi:hypothetical protein